MGRKEFVEERRSKILEFVNKNGRADIGELAEFFTVKEATIRLDLAYLEKQSLVYRSHGGVLRREQMSVWETTTLQDRMNQHQEEKARIAQFVTQLIHEGESLMIDGGSTTMLVAAELCSKKNLLVVTNALALAKVMIDGHNAKVIVTGGELSKETFSLIGNAAEHSIKQYRTDKAIIGVSGILVDEGCFSVSPQEAEIKRLMSQHSHETIIVSDSSKIGTRAFCFLCDFGRINKLVTDRNVTKAALEELKRRGVEVFTV